MVLWSTTWFCVGGTFLQVKRKPVIGTPADTRRFAGEGIATIGSEGARQLHGQLGQKDTPVLQLMEGVRIAGTCFCTFKTIVPSERFRKRLSDRLFAVLVQLTNDKQQLVHHNYLRHRTFWPFRGRLFKYCCRKILTPGSGFFHRRSFFIRIKMRPANPV